MNISLFYSFPIWLTGLGSFIVLIVAIELGYRIGLKSQDKWKDAEIGGGGIVQTSLLALLGLVLAFTYASVVSRHDARKSTVHVEANTLSTSFLRANLVAEPGRTELKEALLDYARTRVMSYDKVKTTEGRKAVVSTTIAMQDKIWPAMMRAFSEQEPAPLKASIISSVNDVLDAHTLRLAAAFDKLPRVIMWMLLLISAASLSVVGYNAGIQGRISRWRTWTFAFVLNVVVIVILDYDRPMNGLVVVEQFSLRTVISDMEADLGR